MSKYKDRCKLKKKIGIALAAIGIGLILSILIPFWGWIIAAGGALVYLGWYLISSTK